MEGETGIKFVKATKESVFSFLKEARIEVVFAKAGYFLDEINTLIELAKNGVRCNIYVDCNENAIRYGFGEQEALEKINENIELLNVQTANFIRMAILIVDETVMVYSPVALSWEDMPKHIDFPNGLIGGSYLAGSLLRQIKGDPIEIKIEGLNIPIQTCPVIQKSPEEIKQKIEATISVLKENPPIDPADLRKTTFYRHKYKLLKMTLHGVRIKDKSIPLRPFNSMLPKTNLRLKSSWSVLTQEDVKNLVALKNFLMRANVITAKHTFDAKRYGTLIERKNIRILENCISFQVYELVGQLMKENTIDSKKENNDSNKSLLDLLKESRAALIDYLLPQIIDVKSCWSQLFENDRTLLRQMQEGKITEVEAVKQAVETFVDFRLNFPNAQEMIDLIHVEFDYYDISDELLAKEDFIRIVERFDIEVRDYHEGYEKNKQISLFEFSD